MFHPKLFIIWSRQSYVRGGRLEGTPQVQDQEGGGETGSQEGRKDRSSKYLNTTSKQWTNTSSHVKEL